MFPATVPMLKSSHDPSTDTCGRGEGEGSERTKSRSLSPFGMTGGGEAERAITARLKPCPDARNASAGPTHKAARPASEGGPYKSLPAGCGELSGLLVTGRWASAGKETRGANA